MLSADPEAVLAQVRDICLALPETDEVISHGIPAFRVAGKRTLGEMTTFDLLLLLIISETTQQAMVGEDRSLTNAFLLETAQKLRMRNEQITRVEILALLGHDLGHKAFNAARVVEDYIDRCRKTMNNRKEQRTHEHPEAQVQRQPAAAFEYWMHA